MRLAQGFLLLLAGVAVFCAPASAQPLVLNEILAGPTRDWDASGAFSSRDDEWIELMNTGATDLDVSSYFVTDGDSIPRYRFSGMLGPRQFLFVTGKHSWDWERANGFPAFGLSLANSGDAVILWQIAGDDTVEVDRYAYRSFEALADRSVGRRPDGGDAWSLFDSLNPYTGTVPPLGNGCEPTPGAGNGCTVTPVRASTWGAVKHAYR
jgi:hypothetical protein